MRLVDDQHEVGVEGQPLTGARLEALGHQRRVRVRGVQPVAHLAPHGRRGRDAPFEVEILDQREGHVDPEAGDAPLEPEADHVLQGLPVAARSRGVGGVPPRLVIGEVAPAEVQRRLLVVEVLQVPALPRARRGHPGRDAGDVVGPPGGRLVGAPDVAVALGARPVGGQLGLEPRVLDAGVPGDEVEQHPDAALAGRGHQLDHVLVGAVARGDGEVVGHVVPGVDERRGEAGVEPDHVDAERGDVVEVVDHAAQVAHAVAVGVGERLRIDLVDHRVGQPVSTHRGSLEGWLPVEPVATLSGPARSVPRRRRSRRRGGAGGARRAGPRTARTRVTPRQWIRSPRAPARNDSVCG